MSDMLLDRTIRSMTKLRERAVYLQQLTLAVIPPGEDRVLAIDRAALLIDSIDSALRMAEEVQQAGQRVGAREFLQHSARVLKAQAVIDQTIRQLEARRRHQAQRGAVN